MLEALAHRLGGALSSSLRQPVHVELSKLDQLPWEDFAGELPEPTFLSSAVLLPLEGRSVLRLPVALCLLLIDCYLGGDGCNEPEREQLTEIEQTLVSGLVEELWQQVPQAFSTFVTLSPAMIATSTSAMLVQVGRPGILCLVVRMTLSLDPHSFELELCLPVNVVLSLVDQLERHQRSGGVAGGPDRRETRRRLLSVPVELKLAYPPIGLTPAELLGLQVGDVIHLSQMDATESGELELTIGEVSFGTGLLVESGNRLACTILTKKEPSHEQ